MVTKTETNSRRYHIFARLNCYRPAISLDMLSSAAD
jgi:hypothetical protein